MVVTFLGYMLKSAKKKNTSFVNPWKNCAWKNKLPLDLNCLDHIRMWLKFDESSISVIKPSTGFLKDLTEKTGLFSKVASISSSVIWEWE